MTKEQVEKGKECLNDLRTLRIYRERIGEIVAAASTASNVLGFVQLPESVRKQVEEILTVATDEEIKRLEAELAAI
jgi:hypothetical protein